jgi:seryl-tRNA synthetase
VPLWVLIVTPVATLLGILAVMLAALYQNRGLDSLRREMERRFEAQQAEINSLRAEVKQYIAEAELRILKEIFELKRRVERLEEQRGLIRQL